MAKSDRIGKHATVVYTDDARVTHVVYHKTAVVKFIPYPTGDRLVTINSGGWDTPTTKLRMNQTSNQFSLGFSVWQRNHLWYVTLPEGGTIPFEDHMSFFV